MSCGFASTGHKHHIGQCWAKCTSEADINEIFISPGLDNAARILDVLNADGTIKEEMRLTAEQTKGKHARTVVLAEKLRKELHAYLKTRFTDKELIAVTYSAYMNKPLFATQKREGFNANTACHHFHMLIKAVV